MQVHCWALYYFLTLHGQRISPKHSMLKKSTVITCYLSQSWLVRNFERAQLDSFCLWSLLCLRADVGWDWSHGSHGWQIVVGCWVGGCVSLHLGFSMWLLECPHNWLSPEHVSQKSRNFLWICFCFLFCLLAFSNLFVPPARPDNCLLKVRH